MVSDWEIARSAGQCSVSGRAFAEGEVYFAALFEDAEGLHRRDYSVDVWTGPPEGCLYYWRARVPVREHKNTPVMVDNEVLIQLFTSMENTDSPARLQFRFVLALLLMRKRLLRLESTRRQDESEVWKLRLVRDGSEHLVVDPQLTGDQVDRLNSQLLLILRGEAESLEQLDTLPPPESVPPAEPSPETPADAADPADATDTTDAAATPSEPVS